MTTLSLVLYVISLFSLVGGQIFLKRGMSQLNRRPRRYGPVFAGVGSGTALLTVWFLIWMGLLQKMDISYVYPFQGMGPVLLVLSAMLILRERVDWRTWLGVGLIAAGTVFVAMSPPASGS